MVNNKNETDKKEAETVDKPDETGGIYVRNFLRITDPESDTVLVETSN